MVCPIVDLCPVDYTCNLCTEKKCDNAKYIHFVKIQIYEDFGQEYILEEKNKNMILTGWHYVKNIVMHLYILDIGMMLF